MTTSSTERVVWYSCNTCGQMVATGGPAPATGCGRCRDDDWTIDPDFDANVIATGAEYAALEAHPAPSGHGLTDATLGPRLRPMREILDLAQTALEYLEPIRARIREIETHARAHPSSWEYHGDLQFVVEQLDEVDTFLGSR